MTTTNDPEADDLLATELDAHQRALELGSAPATTSASVDDPLRARIDRGKRCLDLLHHTAHGALPPPDPRQSLPKNVGRFEIRSLLGAGGFGIVYRAYDPVARREVALKVPAIQAYASAELLGRFQQEAAAAAKLDHPNIVPVLEAGLAGTIPYIASIYYASQTLAEWLNGRPGPATPPDAARFVRQMAAAAQHAHDRGVLHRDIKPSNILLAPRYNGGETGNSLSDFLPKLTDFGLAKLAESTEDFTRSGAILGTLRYMAPEQARGDVRAITVATDVYALGVVLFQLLTGQPPFDATSDVDLLVKITTAEPHFPRRGRVPLDLETICLKCLAIDPRQRYRSAAELADDLDHYLAGETILARPAGMKERIVKWARRRPVSAVLAAVAVVSLGMGVAGVLWHTRQLDAALTVAELRRSEAEASQQEMRRHVYASDIRLAEQAIISLRGGECLGILNKLVPKVGDADLREFAWGHLWARTHLARRELRGLGAEVYALAYQPGRRRIAAGGSDGVLRLLDADTGQLLCERADHGGEITAIDFSPDGRQLASVSESGEMLQWIAGDELGLKNRCSPSSDAIFAVRYSPDGTDLAVGGEDRVMRILNADTRVVERELTGHVDQIMSLAYSTDGRRLISGGHDGRLLAWDLAGAHAGGSETWARYDGTQVRAVAASPDGKFVAFGAGRVRVVRAEDKERVAQCDLGAEGVTALAFTPRGDQLVFACRDSTCGIWDWSNADSLPRQFVGHDGRVVAVAVASDGREFATSGADGTVRLWATDTNERAQSELTLTLQEAEFAISANGMWAIIETEKRKAAEVVQWVDNEWQSVDHCQIERPCSLMHCEISDDGGWIFTAGFDHGLYAWHRGTGEPWRRIGQFAAPVTSIVTVPGRNILVVATKSELQAFKFEGDGPLWRAAILEPSDEVRLRATPDRVFYAAGMTVAVHDAESGASLFRREVPGDQFNDVALLPDGSQLLAASVTRSIQRWSLPGGDRLQPWVGHQEGVIGLAVHPLLGSVASVDEGNVVKIWHRATGQPMLTLVGNGGRSRLVFSADGRRLLTAGTRGTTTRRIRTYFSQPSG